MPTPPRREPAQAETDGERAPTGEDGRAGPTGGPADDVGGRATAVEAQAGSDGRTGEDKPELLIKLQERKERHGQRGVPARVGVVVAGVVLVLAGIVLSGPGVPGPGFLVILIGLSFLALEFDRAERLLERAIRAADRAKDRAENAGQAQKIATTVGGLLAAGAFVAAAILWDIPLLPV